jgi:AcrR family transcriptional regulator
VLDAALRVVEEEGADALGTGAVAAALGIRAPSVYHHYPGNDALRLAVAVAGWERMVATFPPPAGDAAASLRALAHAYRDFARAHPALYRVMTATPFDPTHPGLLAVTERGLVALSDLGVGGVEAIHAIRGLRAAIHGFVDLENAGQVRLGVPADESFAWLLERVIRGIAS